MKRWTVCVLLGLLSLAWSAAAEDAAGPTRTPKLHRSACSLAESMASRLAAKKMTPEQAQQTCQQLAPTLNAADQAEFLRCCSARLVGP